MEKISFPVTVTGALVFFIFAFLFWDLFLFTMFQVWKITDVHSFVLGWASL